MRVNLDDTCFGCGVFLASLLGGILAHFCPDLSLCLLIAGIAFPFLLIGLGIGYICGFRSMKWMGCRAVVEAMERGKP